MSPDKSNPCRSFQIRALKFLVKTTLLWWAIAAGLGVWQVVSGLELGGVIVVVAGLGMTGALCYAITRSSIDAAGVLLMALKASRQRPTGPGLRLVSGEAAPQENGSSTQPAHRPAP